MAILIPCPKCANAIQATAEILGKKVKCRKCGAVFVLQEPAPPPPDPEPASDQLDFTGSGSSNRRRWYYKCVPMPPEIAVAQEHRAETAAANHLETLLEEYAVDGWEFHRVDTITADIAPGCLGALLGQRGESRRLYVVTFRRPA